MKRAKWQIVVTGEEATARTVLHAEGPYVRDVRAGGSDRLSPINQFNDLPRNLIGGLKERCPVSRGADFLGFSSISGKAVRRYATQPRGSIQ
jgi:hypothetical protein